MEPPSRPGVVKWGGVRFADQCKSLGVQPMAQRVMFQSYDKFATVEDVTIAILSRRAVSPAVAHALGRQEHQGDWPSALRVGIGVPAPLQSQLACIAPL